MSEENTQNETLEVDGHLEESIEHHQETADQGPIGAVAGQFGLNGQIFLAQLLNFAIVLVILWRFVYKPIVKMLDERSEKIEKSMKQADEIEKRMNKIESEKQDIIGAAKKEATEIAEKAHQQAQERQEEILGAAKKEVEKIIDKGKEQLLEEKNIMMKELRKDIVDLAVKASTRILRDGIDEGKSKSLAEEVVRKLI